MAATIQDMNGDVARTLRLSITGECNLDCFYCKPTGRSKDLFQPKTPVQPSDVTKLVKILGEKGVSKVLISGGEPLLRKDAANFVKSATAHRAIQEVRLVTNGTYLKAHADALRKLGLRKVDINFDTLKYEKYQTLTKKDDLFRVLDGIEKVEKLNYTSIRVNVFMLRGINDEELVDFARMTKDHKIYLRFMEYDSNGTQKDSKSASRLFFPALAAKRMINNYQKLVMEPELEGEHPVPAFRFVDGLGKMSFLSRDEVAKEDSTPRVAFNASGVFFNEAASNRGHAILADLRRDAKETKLHRTIERVLTLHAAPAPKKKASKSVTTLKTKTTTRAKRAARA